MEQLLGCAEETSIKSLAEPQTRVFGWLEKRVELYQPTVLSKCLELLLYGFLTLPVCEMIRLLLFQDMRAVQAYTVLFGQVTQFRVNKVVNVNLGVANLFSVDLISHQKVQSQFVSLGLKTLRSLDSLQYCCSLPLPLNLQLLGFLNA